MQRRVAVVFQVVDLGASLAQGIDQVADGPLVHTRHPGQGVVAAGQGASGGERAEGGAGITEEQVGVLDRKGAADALDPVVVGAFVTGPVHAQMFQGLQHHAGVVGIEQRLHFGRAFGQGGQQQNAVGYALRAGQAHRAASTMGGGQVDMVGSGHSSFSK